METNKEICLRENMYKILPELKSATDTLEYLLSLLKYDNIDYTEYENVIAELNVIYPMYLSDEESVKHKKAKIINSIESYLAFYQNNNERHNLYYIIDAITHIIGVEEDTNIFFSYDFFSLLFSSSNKCKYISESNLDLFIINQNKYDNRLKKSKMKYSLLTENIKNRNFTIRID